MIRIPFIHLVCLEHIMVRISSAVAEQLECSDTQKVVVDELILWRCPLRYPSGFV